MPGDILLKINNTDVQMQTIWQS
ncbi:MAG: hypothetical protein ACLUO4_06880 [Christensenellales bacterium]